MNETETYDRITAAVCDVFSVRRRDIFSPKRPRHIATPRLVAMMLCYDGHVLASTTRVAHYFNRKDHASVLYAQRQVTNLCGTDPAFAASVQRIKERVNA